MLCGLLTHWRHWWHDVSGSPLEQYLAQSSDLYDLEFRFRQVSHGAAPFQRHNLNFGIDPPRR